MAIGTKGQLQKSASEATLVLSSAPVASGALGSTPGVAVWVSQDIRFESRKGRWRRYKSWDLVCPVERTRSERLGNRGCQRPGKGEAWRQEGLYLEVQSS